MKQLGRGAVTAEEKGARTHGIEVRLAGIENSPGSEPVVYVFGFVYFSEGMLEPAGNLLAVLKDWVLGGGGGGKQLVKPCLNEVFKEQSLTVLETDL